MEIKKIELEDLEVFDESQENTIGVICGLGCYGYLCGFVCVGYACVAQ